MCRSIGLTGYIIIRMTERLGEEESQEREEEI